MKFLCIGYFDPARLEWLSAAQLDTLMTRCAALLQALYATGRVLLDVGVKEEGAFVRRDSGNSIISGMYSERIGALVGGAFVIEAGNTDEALQIAALHPAASLPTASELGWRLEVRPVRYLQMPGNAIASSAAAPSVAGFIHESACHDALPPRH